MASNTPDEATSLGLDVPKRSHFSPHNPLSPLRHHQRTPSANKRIKETRNARSQYTNSEDDGASQRRINQYVIEQEIGRGSFGSVHLAIDQFGQEYAVKMFSKHRLRRRAKSNMLRQAKQQRQQTGLPGMMDSPGVKQDAKSIDENAFDLIKEEIAIMKKLDHDNLVSLIEVLDDPDDDSLYMVLEMCKKGPVMRMDLEETLEPYNDENCRLWFRDLILGIEYLHAQGVVHRDIKPDNCLVTEDNVLKLVDFGVSEMFDKASNMTIAKSAGSPAFMAPELCVVRQDGVAGKPADIWSMGVTLYCLRFGRVPFRTSNMLELYDSIAKEDVDLSGDCSVEMKDLFKRLLEKDPEKRITMKELREHPWVTKNDEDKLLPAEENCASPITAPTEEEKNTAITDNLGHFVVVLKAANKFKKKLEKHHPELMESILGRASKMVAPPLTMSGVHEAGSDIKGAFKRHFSRDRDDTMEFPMTGSAIYRAKDLTKEEENIMEKMRTTSLAKRSATDPDQHSADPAMATGSKDKERSKTEYEHRPTYDSSAKGHAHDVLRDQIFVDIGSGPCEKEEDEAKNEEDHDHHHDYVVSESPSQSEESVFEKAYEKEVEEIKRSGRPTTIYKTRRIDRMWDKLHGRRSDSQQDLMGGSTPAPSQPRESFRGVVGSALGKKMQAQGEKLQAKYQFKPTDQSSSEH